METSFPPARILLYTFIIAIMFTRIACFTQKVTSRSLISNSFRLFSFRAGDQIQIEIKSFGPLGASVDVVAKSHDPNDVIEVDEEPIATGLVLQKEIQYFRQARDNLDIVRGELLPAYVERVREDGKLDISLREYGGFAKAQSLRTQILDKLKQYKGTLPVGDKSRPEDISEIFPGTSKSTFKKAVANLYKEGLVTPGPSQVTLNKK